MIVPAADAARAVAYSPEHRRGISLYVSRNKRLLLSFMPSNYINAEGTAFSFLFSI